MLSDDGGYLYDFQQRPAALPVVRVLGLYEPSPVDGATVEVYYDTPQPTILVLVSYDPVHWEVVEAYAGTIQEVIVTGYHGPTADVPATATLTTWDTYYGRAWDAARVRYLEDDLWAEYGLEISSYHGQYDPDWFQVLPSTEVPAYPEYPQCDDPSADPGASTPGADTSVLGTDCEEVRSESRWCLTSLGHGGGGLHLIGLDSGDTCDLGVESPGTWTLEWIGDHVYGCGGYDDMVQRVSLGSGFTEKAYVYCDGVFDRDGELLIAAGHYDPYLSEHKMALFESWYDAGCGEADALDGDFGLSRFGSDEDHAYAAWHSTDHLEVYDLDTLEWERSLYLEGHDGWIYGVGLPGDGTVVISHRGDPIKIFDLETGELLDSLSLGLGVGGGAGLVCFTAE